MQANCIHFEEILKKANVTHGTSTQQMWKIEQSCVTKSYKIGAI